MVLTRRFEDALVHAARLHAAQRRKGSGSPYVSHLLAVASIVLEHGGGEDDAVAALLHDAVEDQGGLATLEEIRRRFGDAVAATVLACSDSVETPKRPWRERKESYIRNVAGASASACLVSAADKLHNARSILTDYRENGDAVWDKFTGGREGSIWYYREVTDVLAPRIPPALARELDRTVGEIERLARA